MRITRNQPVAPEKLLLAKQLRRAMTREEGILWSALRNNSLANLHFRRQQVVAGFVADFYCARARLVIEVDGDSHLGRAEYDSVRDRAFSELGIRTVRVCNEAVVTDLPGVLSRIVAEATSPLTLLPPGEGKIDRARW